MTWNVSESRLDLSPVVVDDFVQYAWPSQLPSPPASDPPTPWVSHPVLSLPLLIYTRDRTMVHRQHH
jgi:hypothetical protein